MSKINKVLILLLMAFSTISCGIHKENTKVETSTTKQEEVQLSKVQLQGLINEIQKSTLTASYHRQDRNLQLKAIDDSKPAKLIEKVNGETVRETIVENGTLNESSEHSDSLMVMEITHQKSVITELREDVVRLKEEDKKQSEQIKYLERDNTKLVSGLKYAAIIAIIGLLAFLMWRLKLF